MERTKIVLIDMSALLREIVREAVADEPDLEIVGEHPSSVDVREAVDGADFVIVGADAASQESVEAVVGSGHRVRALEVHSDGKESVLYELRPRRISLGEISSDTLLRAIRAAPSWDATA